MSGKKRKAPEPVEVLVCSECGDRVESTKNGMVGWGLVIREFRCYAEGCKGKYQSLPRT